MEFSIEEVTNINDRLANGESIRAISLDLKLNKSTITDLFKKNGYVYSSATRQYILDDKLDSKPTIKPTIKPAIKPTIVDKPILNIPFKKKTKTETKAFNVVINKGLVDKLDSIAKDRNYSRTQLIAFLLQWCIDNTD